MTGRERLQSTESNLWGAQAPSTHDPSLNLCTEQTKIRWTNNPRKGCYSSSTVSNFSAAWLLNSFLSVKRVILIYFSLSTAASSTHTVPIKGLEVLAHYFSLGLYHACSDVNNPLAATSK